MSAQKLRKIFNGVSETKSNENSDRVLVVRISTPSEDRSRDIVRPLGVKLENYLKNPVVAAFHRYDQPPIGKAISVTPMNDGIVAEVLFTPEGVNPMADMIYELNKGGFMNAWSIGFSPLKSTPRGGDWRDGRDFEEWELLEFSAVLVPDNPEALTMIRSKGLNPDELLQESAEVTDEIAPVSKIKNISFDTKENKLVLNLEDGKNVEFSGSDEVFSTISEMEKAYTEAKEGRVLSEKNRNLVKTVLDGLSSVETALKELLAATEKIEEENEKSQDEISHGSFDTLEQLRDSLRGSYKGTGLVLRELNKLLTRKGGE